MRVFIIDDDHMFSQALKAYLEKEGIEFVHEFQFVSDAVKELNLHPDVVILDHFIHGLNGVDFIPFINERLPNVRIFYVSGQRKVEILAQAKLLGATHYFKKDQSVFENIVKAIKTAPIAKEAGSSRFLRGLKRKLRKTARPTIFLMDDDRLFSTFVQHKISKFGDFNIKTFDERDALLKAAPEKPDLLILDYHLTGITGNVILKEFKEVCPETKVIMFTSQQNLNTALELFESGIVDYVVKNVEWEKSLRVALEKQLNITLD